MGFSRISFCSDGRRRHRDRRDDSLVVQQPSDVALSTALHYFWRILRPTRDPLHDQTSFGNGRHSGQQVGNNSIK